MQRYLFVYGSLRGPARNRFARALHHGSIFVGAARVKAKKYQIGGYAAMVTADGSSVDGELYRLRDPENQLDSLDEYEGPAYRRAIVKATTKTGKRIRCWSYLYRFRLKRSPYPPQLHEHPLSENSVPHKQT